MGHMPPGGRCAAPRALALALSTTFAAAPRLAGTTWHVVGTNADASPTCDDAWG